MSREQNPYGRLPGPTPEEYAQWRAWELAHRPPRIVRETTARVAPPQEPMADVLAQLRSALLDTDELDNLPEPEPLVAGILQTNSLAWLQGRPGHAKSFVGLDIAASVGTGESWQGHPVTPGFALYLIAEGARGFRKRVRAWEKAFGHSMTGVRFLPVAVQSGTPSQWDALVALVAELHPVLVVIDTQARVTVGKEENSAKDMGEFVDQLERLRQASGSCVLVLHHQGRTGEHMRGSTALEGAATTIVKLEKSEEQVVTVSCVKQKDDVEFDRFTLRLVPMGESVILAPAAGVSRSSDVPRWLGTWWETHRDDWISTTAVIKAEVTSEATWHRYKHSLVERGLLQRRGEGNATRYRLPCNPLGDPSGA